MKKLSVMQIIGAIGAIGLIVAGADYLSQIFPKKVAFNFDASMCSKEKALIFTGMEKMQVRIEYSCSERNPILSNKSNQNRWIFDKNGIGYFLKGGATNAVLPQDIDLKSLSVTNYDPCLSKKEI